MEEIADCSTSLLRLGTFVMGNIDAQLVAPSARTEGILWLTKACGAKLSALRDGRKGR